MDRNAQFIKEILILDGISNCIVFPLWSQNNCLKKKMKKKWGFIGKWKTLFRENHSN